MEFILIIIVLTGCTYAIIDICTIGKGRRNPAYKEYKRLGGTDSPHEWKEKQELLDILLPRQRSDKQDEFR